ncbi:MAG: hypothetical protein EOO68_36120, partial [Moraxellaceae bacterium]
MKKIIGIFLFSTLLGFNSLALASEYTLVLVHGFQPSKLSSRPTPTQVEQNGVAYWSKFWGARTSVRIDWPSHERVANRITTDYVWPKLQQMSINGTCRKGCIFLTHSTGDLVTRHIIDNQALWLENAGLQPLNIVATFDFAGAGGGTDLADLAVNSATGSSLINKAGLLALTAWLGSKPTPEALGVLNDLRVNTARHISPFPEARVPRLRFAASADDYYGVTSLFISGEDDGVVPSHSSCGASTAGSFETCSRNVAFDGELDNQSDGVSNFMPQHYPMLMSAEYSHGNVVDAQHKGEITAANSRANFIDNTQLG